VPIEIRELVVKARVEPKGEQVPVSGGSRPGRVAADEAAIVRACVKEVLRILESKRER